MPTEAQSPLILAADSEASCADCTADVPVSGFRSPRPTSGSRSDVACSGSKRAALRDGRARLRPGLRSSTSGRRGLPLVRPAAAWRRICRKYRRVRFDQLQDDEYNKLRRMVPALRAIDERDNTAWNSHHHRRQQLQRQQPRRQSQQLVVASRQTCPPHRPRVTKIKVITETIRYIDHLHRMLIERLHSDNNNLSPVTLQADDLVDKQSVINAAKMAFLQTSAASDVDQVTSDSGIIGSTQQLQQNCGLASCPDRTQVFTDSYEVVAHEATRNSDD